MKDYLVWMDKAQFGHNFGHMPGHVKEKIAIKEEYFK